MVQLFIFACMVDSEPSHQKQLLIMQSIVQQADDDTGVVAQVMLIAH